MKKEWWEGGKTAGAKSQEFRTQDSGVTTLCPCRPWPTPSAASWPTPSEVNTLIIQHLEFVKCEYKHENKYISSKKTGKKIGLPRHHLVYTGKSWLKKIKSWLRA